MLPGTLAWAGQLYTVKWKNMAFKNFKIQVTVRSIMFGFVFAIYQNQWYVTSASLLVISVLLLVGLIRFVEKTRREISNFLTSVKLRDFTSLSEIESTTENKNPDLIDAFKLIAGEFQNVRIEKEMHYQYLQTLVEHVETALICFEKNGKIALMNNSAKKLLNTQSAQTLDFLKQKQAEIAFILDTIQSGQQKLLKTKVNGELVQLAIRATVFRMQETEYKLVALQNIKNELESKELESWQKLIRVLTHEIMNSVTPISSLSQAIIENMEDENGQALDLRKMEDEDFDDIFQSIKTIENRSKGLLKFVETYKNLTKLPQPNFEKINVSDLLNHVALLMKPEFEKKNAKLEIVAIDKQVNIFADHEMLVRVLINLLANALDALIGTKDPMVKMDSFADAENRTCINVSDNGPGMDKETLDNIFIPFFTTKEKGSGIGLSLCRQIMHLHKGSITAVSDLGEGIDLVLKF
jgi:nitrogen fixation/metabolism regulation signal transduction histidine kinase